MHLQSMTLTYRPLINIMSVGPLCNLWLRKISNIPKNNISDEFDQLAVKTLDLFMVNGSPP